MIPKIIHQIWIQGANSMPKEDRIAVESIKNLNPDWQHIIWDDTSIKNLLQEYPDILKVYKNVDTLPSSNRISKWASMSDIAR